MSPFYWPCSDPPARGIGLSAELPAEDTPQELLSEDAPKELLSEDPLEALPESERVRFKTKVARLEVREKII